MFCRNEEKYNSLGCTKQCKDCETLEKEIEYKSGGDVGRKECERRKHNELRLEQLKEEQEEAKSVDALDAVKYVINNTKWNLGVGYGGECEKMPLKKISVNKPEIKFDKDGVKIDGKPFDEIINGILSGSVQVIDKEEEVIFFENEEPEDVYIKQEEDLINKPNHYHKGGVDVYEIAQMKFTPEEYRGFCKGNVLKYLLREDMKGGVEDIKKLRFNADRLIENMENREYIPEYKRTKGLKGLSK